MRRVHEEVVRVTAQRLGRAFKCQRRPDLERRVGRFEARRKNTDHFVGNAVERERAADDSGIRSEAAQPQAVSQQGDSMAAHDAVARCERAPEQRPDPEDIEERRCHHASVEPHRLARARQIDRRGRERRRRIEDGVHACPVHVVRRRHEVVEDALGLPLFPDHHEPIGLVVRKRAQEDRVHRREDGGVGSDTERQRHDRDDRHARLADEEPHRMLQIVCERAHAQPPRSRLKPRSKNRDGGRDSLRRPMNRGIQNGAHPEACKATARLSHRSTLCFEQTRHVVAELAAHPSRKREQQQAIHAHPLDFASRRFDLASSTSASRRLASASATRAPSGVRRK